MPLTANAAADFRQSSLWTASRGNQVVNCELLVLRQGHAVIRCGYGPDALIRSQVIVSAEAAAVVAETWKAAILAQGFRLDPATPTDN
jgi:hypothetical protein